MRRYFLPLLMCCLLMTAMVPVSAQDGGLLERINALRASVGRAGYALNGALNAAAQSQAQWMAETGAVAHTRPDGSSPRSRAMNAGYASAMVSENIYIGTNASAETAWGFWINSAIHYAGLISPNYSEVGIASAAGSGGRAWVLVFGNPGGSYAQPASSGAARAAAPPPAPQRIYAIGVDETGNIMHLIATGDTLGDIALIYGYTWDDIPGMMSLNTMADVRELLPGEVFLVPPKAGTYTPTPGGPTETPRPTATPLPPTITMFVAATVTPDELATMRASELVLPATLEAMQSVTTPPDIIPTPTSEAVLIADAGIPPALIDPPIQPALAQTITPPRNPASLLIGIALAVQAGIVVLAGVDFVRRHIRKGQLASRQAHMTDIHKSDVIGQPVRRKGK